jgi:FemAB-related protein (PEP-CTERM system-associated)
VLTIKRLSPHDLANGASWDAFVMASPDATFFHLSGWQRVLRDAFRHDTHFLYAEVDGRIQGVLPLAHVRSVLFGHSLVSLPFAVYGGVAAATPSASASLEREAQELAHRLGVDHLELRHVTPRHTDWPAQDLYVTFRKPLLPDPEANMLAIPRKQRAMVRKGLKNGLRSEIDGSIERFYPLYADNMHRHGSPALPRRYFNALMHEFGDRAEVMTVVDPGGRPLSSVLSFYFRDEVLPYYAGDETSARDLAANDFKYWELMRRCAERGIKLFDYGRSKQGSGSFAFKKNWGFEPQPLHYEYCLYKRSSVPQNNPANPKYKLLIQTWRHMPIGIANWLSPFIVRSLG